MNSWHVIAHSAELFCPVLGLNPCYFGDKHVVEKKCKLGNVILKHGETILAPSIMMIDEACTDRGGSSFLSIVGVLLSDYTASHVERQR
jgi:hypothetical protein